jgi:hypothetical protein
MINTQFNVSRRRFLASAGIRLGVKLQGTDNTVVAPTIAKLLDLKYPYADGKPLSDALRISTCR